MPKQSWLSQRGNGSINAAEKGIMFFSQTRQILTGRQNGNTTTIWEDTFRRKG